MTTHTETHQRKPSKMPSVGEMRLRLHREIEQPTLRGGTVEAWSIAWEIGIENGSRSSCFDFNGDKSTASSLVRQCNSFPALLAALEGLFKAFPAPQDTEEVEALNAALAAIAAAKAP